MMSLPNILYTTANDICTGCGICSGACPNGAISFIVKKSSFRPQVNESLCKNSKGCHRCFDACPGVGIDLINFAKNIFEQEKISTDRILGPYIQCFIGHSTDYDMRYHSASGGALSHFLIYLLEHGEIDGALVTKFCKESPLKVKSFIATTREDIIAARSSKYAPTSFYEAFSEIKKFGGSRLVVVGVPCQIEGMRKLMSIDKKIREKVCGLFSVYCSGSRSFSFTEYVLKTRKIDVDKLDFLAYRDNGCLGGMVAKGDGIDFYEDYQRYCHPLRSIFIPHRCMLCVDHFGELADISFGDIHKPPYSEDKIGINSIIVRDSVWLSKLRNAAEQKSLFLKELSSSEILASQKMAYIKKKRNVVFALIEKKLGKRVPEFGSTYGATIGIKSIVDYIQVFVQRLIGNNRLLWWLIPFLKAKVRIR